MNWKTDKTTGMSFKSISKTLYCTNPENSTYASGPSLLPPHLSSLGFGRSFKCGSRPVTSTCTLTTSKSTWPTTLCKRMQPTAPMTACWTKTRSGSGCRSLRGLTHSSGSWDKSSPRWWWLQWQAMTRLNGSWTRSPCSAGISWLTMPWACIWSSAIGVRT